MHHETLIVHRKNIKDILKAKGPIVPVGTTALRALESLYWYGAKLTKNPDAHFFVSKQDPYETGLKLIPIERSMHAVLAKMDQGKTSTLKGKTGIFIYPGYGFKVADGLFTNFHMPASTLVLLVAAFVGGDWRRIYNEALASGYRFLSYGDTSLLLR